MEKSSTKKIRVMDIVRKKAVHHEEINPLLGREQQAKFAVEQKREALRAEVRKEVVPVHVVESVVHAPVKEVVEEKIEKKEVVAPHEEMHKEEVKTHIETPAPLHMIPEASSLELDRPIAYIPKEKQSREEKKILERIERRERFSEKGGEKKGTRSVVAWLGICALLVAGVYVAITVLPRAEISLVPKTWDWAYANPIFASTKIADIDLTNKQIPVAVFLEKKTNAFSFPATGSGKSIERKATGSVIIYNEFSETTQPLVAGTRLETPDGKIFRLAERVVIPGAKKTGGELIATSIEASVIADKAGESYNISPVSKFTIPGFEGTAKFDGFYAESKNAMTGGFIGVGKYPTESDIKVAKESAKQEMKEIIDSFLSAMVLDGFKVIDGSDTFKITKEVVNEAVNEEGNFSIYIEAEGGIDALKEEYVLKLMTAMAQQVKGEGYAIKEHTLSYGDMTTDAKTGIIALPVDFTGIFWKPIDLADFKGKIMGKTQDELKSIIFSSTSIEKADVSLWPFWVKTVPNDAERVKVELK